MTGQPRNRSVWPMVAAAFVLVPVLYVLGSGPALWLYVNYGGDYEWAGEILDLTYGWTEGLPHGAFSRWLRWYMAKWF